MKFIHTGDLHCNKERYPLVVKSILDMDKKCREDNIDAVLICGDTWDSTITASDASGFNEMIDAVGYLCETVPVYMIYGTASHEPIGSLHVFEKVGVHVLNQDGNPYKPSFLSEEKFELVAIPEPRLSLIEGNSIEEKYNFIQGQYRGIASAISVLQKNKPRIVMFHGLIHGALLDNGMQVPKGETAIDRDILDGIGADYIACAHIHRRQKVGGMRTPCYYCGSLPPKNFGETHESGFNIVEI